MKFIIPFEKSSKSGIITILIILGLLEFFLRNSIIPTPSDVILVLPKIISYRDFFSDLISSLTLTFKGIIYSTIISCLFAYVYKIPLFTNFVVLISKVRYLTIAGLITVLTLLFPNGGDFKIAVVIVGIVPFFVTSFISVIDDIDSSLYDLCYVLKFSKWRTLYEVIIVGKLDYILEIARQNFAIAWLTICTAEGLNISAGGLGTLIAKANKSFGIASALGVLLIILLVGILFDILFKYLRVWFFPYSVLKKI